MPVSLKNYLNGINKSSYSLKLLWSIKGGVISLHTLLPQCALSVYE